MIKKWKARASGMIDKTVSEYGLAYNLTEQCARHGSSAEPVSGLER